MRRRTSRQKQHFKIKIPRLMFTLEQLVFLRKALLPLEQVVLTTTNPNPKVDFALATVTQVQAKINIMIEQGEWGRGVGFDANELLILRTALWIFQVGLDCVPPSPENEKLKQQSRTLDSILGSPLK